MAAAKWARRGILILAIVIALVPLLPLTENSFTDSSPQGSPGRSEPPWQGYGALPLRFDANAGQDPASVLYEATGSGMTAFLTSQGATLRLAAPDRRVPAVRTGFASALTAGDSDQALQIAIVGGRQPTVVPGDQLSGSTNYLLGRDPSAWHTGVPSYGLVTYKGVYPGIDLTFRGDHGQLEFDFEVRPWADPSAIEVALVGARSLSFDSGRNLVVDLGSSRVLQRVPSVYQDAGGTHRSVAGQYTLRGGDRVGFRLGSYDRSRAVLIDPVLAYSTYMGGSGFDTAYGVAVDSAGDAFVAGVTTSTDFPVAESIYGANPGHARAFVQKVNPSGTGLVYSTYLGGSGNDAATAIAVDAAGNAFVVGTTTSGDFPAVNAAQPVYGGGSDAFVAELNPTGSALNYSTYLGGSALDVAYGVAVDGTGNAYVDGVTLSTNFPTRAALQPTSGGAADGFVVKMSPSGAIVYATYLGGSGQDGAYAIAVDSTGAAYVAGVTTSGNFPTASPLQATLGGVTNAFVTKISPSGSSLAYSTYLGGNGSDSAQGIAVDQSGDAFVAGSTTSTNFPISQAFLPVYRGNGDAFVSKIDSSGTSLAYSTYLGGSGYDTASSIAVDAYGDAYVAGTTTSTDFVTFNSLQGYGGNGDAFVTMVTPGGGLTAYSTYLGGSGGDGAQGLTVDGAGAVYVVGTTTSADFPTSGPLDPMIRGGTDAFITKISPAFGPSSWPTYMGDQTHSGNNTDQVLLNPFTARYLRHIWSAHAPDFVTGQPAIGNGLIYWGAFDGYERATDPSGRTIWSTFLGKTVTAPQPLPDCLGGSVGITGTGSLANISGGRTIFVAGGDANLYALNAMTGAILWKTSLGTQPKQFLWSSPLYYNGSVYEGVASFQECPPVQGQVVQLDAATGALLHTWNAVPAGCTGGPVSSSAAVDAATGTIFIATGSSPNSCATPYDAAMIALRASDLTLVSSWQVPAALQGPDGDFLASPMLFTANIGGVQRSLVGLVHKNGVYYTFDRSNISAGPIWSATVGLSGDCPICGPPGAAIAPSAWDGSAIYVGGNSTTINGATCNGSVRALDPATGTFIWQRCLGSPVLGAISVTRGVVAVAAGSSFYVFSAATGAILYVFQDTNPAPPPYTGGIASFWGGPAIGQGVLYVGDIAGSLFAFSV